MEAGGLCACHLRELEFVQSQFSVCLAREKEESLGRVSGLEQKCRELENQLETQKMLHREEKTRTVVVCEQRLVDLCQAVEKCQVSPLKQRVAQLQEEKQNLLLVVQKIHRDSAGQQRIYKERETYAQAIYQKLKDELQTKNQQVVQTLQSLKHQTENISSSKIQPKEQTENTLNRKYKKKIKQLNLNIDTLKIKLKSQTHKKIKFQTQVHTLRTATTQNTQIQHSLQQRLQEEKHKNKELAERLETYTFFSDRFERLNEKISALSSFDAQCLAKLQETAKANLMNFFEKNISKIEKKLQEDVHNISTALKNCQNHYTHAKGHIAQLTLKLTSTAKAKNEVEAEKEAQITSLHGQIVDANTALEAIRAQIVRQEIEALAPLRLDNEKKSAELENLSQCLAAANKQAQNYEFKISRLLKLSQRENARLRGEVEKHIAEKRTLEKENLEKQNLEKEIFQKEKLEKENLEIGKLAIGEEEKWEDLSKLEKKVQDVRKGARCEIVSDVPRSTELRLNRMRHVNLIPNRDQSAEDARGGGEPADAQILIEQRLAMSKMEVEMNKLRIEVKEKKRDIHELSRPVNPQIAEFHHLKVYIP